MSEADEDLEELYEHAPCGYLSTRPDGTIVRVNQTLLAWLGRTREEVVGTRFQDLLTIPGRIFHDTHYAPLLAIQGAVKEIAFDVLRRDRSPLPAIVSTTARRDRDGRVVLYRTTLFDCSDRRRYEQELLAARRAAERAVSAKNALLSTISHEMRSPLSAIIMATQLSERAGPTADTARLLEIIAKSASTVLELVNAILDHSRLEAGALSWQPRAVDLHALLEEIAAIFTLKAEAKGLTLELVRDERLPAHVLTDGFKLGQVLTNLLGNAIKFTERGSIRFAVELVELVGGTARIRFRVRDTGIGVARERIDAIFEEFEQASPDTVVRYGGSGLGLAICRKLLALAGTTMEVRSEPGRGSEFAFVLRAPLSDETAIASPVA